MILALTPNKVAAVIVTRILTQTLILALTLVLTLIADLTLIAGPNQEREPRRTGQHVRNELFQEFSH